MIDQSALKGAEIQPDLATIISRIEGYAQDVCEARMQMQGIADRLYGSCPENVAPAEGRGGTGAIVSIHAALDALRYQIEGLRSEQGRLSGLA